MHSDTTDALSPAQVERFIEDGFLRLDDAFSSQLAEEARTILWRDTGCDPKTPATWTKPVVRLGFYGQPPFVAAANTPRLHAALDEIVGPGRWLPRGHVGTIPVRFPSPDDPGDAGWHIDVSFSRPWDDPTNFLSGRANIVSEGRALLMLFLFSDVGEDDAPTRIRVGSHRDIAQRLADAGPDGMTLGELAANDFAESAHRPLALATGAAGTVYLCHPFLVHAAQPHRGTRPRFLAQPTLQPATPLQLEREDGDYSAVEEAIRRALAGSD